jgi:DNA-binding CsgD family transcriptional regulator
MVTQMKTVISERQLRAYRLCSGEFEGLTSEEAAEEMNITVRALNRLLERAAKAVPILFPMLTKQEADVKALLDISWARPDIANQLNISLSRVSQIINSLYSKRSGVMANSQPVVMQHYESWMDNQIVRKF